MRKGIHQLAVVTMALFMGSCREPFTPPAIKQDYRFLTVNGMLISSLTDSTVIKLTHSLTISDGSFFQKETHATVQIENEDGKIFALTETSNGTYSLKPQLFDAEKKYRINIKTQSNHRYQSDFVPLKKSPDVENLRWRENTDGVQVYLSSRDAKNDSRYYQWSYDETWKYTAYKYSPYEVKNNKIVPRAKADEFYTCWKTAPASDILLYDTKSLSQDVIEDQAVFMIPSSSRKLYYEYSALVKQYVLTEEGYKYWKSVKSNSEDLGGLYDPIPTQVAGNIHAVNDPSEVVIGFFSACEPAQARLSLDRQQLVGPTKYDPSDYESCFDSFVPLSDISNAGGVMIIDAVYDLVTQQLTGYSVSSTDCMDCREKGGTIVRPDYWGN